MRVAWCGGGGGRERWTAHPEPGIPYRHVWARHAELDIALIHSFLPQTLEDPVSLIPPPPPPLIQQPLLQYTPGTCSPAANTCCTSPPGRELCRLQSLLTVHYSVWAKYVEWPAGFKLIPVEECRPKQGTAPTSTAGGLIMYDQRTYTWLLGNGIVHCRGGTDTSQFVVWENVNGNQHALALCTWNIGLRHL